MGTRGWLVVVTHRRTARAAGVRSWLARPVVQAGPSTHDNQAVVITDAMGPFCGIGCVMFALVSHRPVRLRHHPGSWWSSALAALTVRRVAGVAFLLLRSGRGEFMRRNSLPFGAIVAALVGLNPLVYILGTQITYPAIGMLLVIVAVGALVHDWFWATIVIVASTSVWILCAVAFGHHPFRPPPSSRRCSRRTRWRSC